MRSQHVAFIADVTNIIAWSTMNWSLIHMDRKYEQVLAKKKANKFDLPKYRKVDMKGGTYWARKKIHYSSRRVELS